MLGLDLETIDAIATAGGPGSFTGLRIGAATAKGLGLALKKPLIHVPTVDAIAYNMWGPLVLSALLWTQKMSGIYRTLSHGKWYGDRQGTVSYGYGRTDQPVK